MTNYRKVKTCLEDADKPLTAKQIIERTGITSTTVYSLLKRMSRKGKVIRDEDYRGNYSVRYQWRHSRF